MLWKKKYRDCIPWMAWDHLCTPKRLGGPALLNQYEHMAACRFSFLVAMFKDDQPWIEMTKSFIEKVGIRQGKATTRIECSWWNVVNLDGQMRCIGSIVVNPLVASWKSYLEFCHWSPLERENSNSLQVEALATSRLLRWESKHSSDVY